ncbi:unnamed protein product [Callosobruchus maculatus]|uniref:Uncharacterized protein n=1 Tax=Callosobruchus maculatus TaxID=64391 RepID=A0A653BSA4_CALMS|nr:unnamed protein product [Callosobruchus maculatus]
MYDRVSGGKNPVVTNALKLTRTCEELIQRWVIVKWSKMCFFLSLWNSQTMAK